jgi:2-(1,2-epoxy-1,2-dihydrophenyl)acetyl-CoA isomerase
MSTDSVLVEDRGAVRIVTLNRPDKRNAIDIPVRLELASALESAREDNSIRAVVLTGAGTAFCSGGDITSMERMSLE